MTDSQVEAQVENNAEGVQKLTDTKAIIAYLCLLYTSDAADD